MQFKEIHGKWYDDTNKRKIIPADLLLNTTIIKNWIMDDGGIDITKGALRFYTNGFSICDCEFLINKIREFIRTKNGLININYDRDKPIIRLNKIATDILFDKIGSCPVKCFNYKWNRKRRPRCSD